MAVDRGLPDSSGSGAARAARPHSGLFLVVGMLIAILASAASSARAQGSGEGFLFHSPHGVVAVRGGFAHANAGSDIFSFTTDQLTVDRGDFSGFTIGADLTLRIAPRFGVVLGASYAGTSTPSEFRNFVDQNNLPIEQTTTYQRVPVTASLKAYLTPPGRAVGHFAWIPARLAPYVGGGGGAEWYRFRQRGDFVDFQTNDVFHDSFASSGWAPEAHAMAGVDVSLGTRFVLEGEGRYTWAKARLGDDFSGFDRIDLSGFAVTAGVGIRF